MRSFIDLIESALNEISRVPGLDKEEESYEQRALSKKFDEFHPTKMGTLTGLYEFWLAETPTGNFYAFAVDSWGLPVAYLGLQKVKSKTFQVTMVFVDPEERGNGLAFELYLAMLKKGVAILSDNDQTPGGQSIWSKLAADHRVKVQRIDHNGRATDVDDPEDHYDDGETARFRAVWNG